MSRRVIPLALLAGFGAPLAAAESFQWELEAEASLSATDESDELETTVIGVEGRYHLWAVDRGGHPWSEAAFLEHSTWVALRVMHAAVEDDSFEVDGLGYGASARLARPGLPVTASLDLDFIGLEDDGDDIEIDILAVSVRVGYWFLDNLEIGVQVSTEQEDVTVGAFEGEEDELVWGAYGKWVQQLPQDLAINIEGSIVQAQRDDGTIDEANFIVTAEADLYFTPQYSAGALLSFAAGDDEPEEGFSVAIRGTAWFTENIAARAAYETFIAANEDEGGVDEDGFLVGVWGRF